VCVCVCVCLCVLVTAYSSLSACAWLFYSYHAKCETREEAIKVLPFEIRTAIVKDMLAVFNKKLDADQVLCVCVCVCVCASIQVACHSP
jgi:hypothetical protein